MLHTLLFIGYQIQQSYAFDSLIATNISQELDSTINNNEGYLKIEVTACDGWEYGSSSNSLQMQLKTEHGSSPFFFVNKYGSLPTHGRTQIYNTDINYAALVSIVLCIDDDYGYCLKRIIIHSNDDNYGYHSFEYPYFGMGLLLSNNCKYTYTSLSTHRALVRCIDDYLELYTYRYRGIYKVNIHTCMNKHSGISALNMENNVYSVIMGKPHNANVYDTTQIEYIDHYAVGEVHLDRLGHLIATNILLPDPLYTRNIVGKMIGIKLEAVGYNMYNAYIPESVHDKVMVKIDDESKHFYSCSVLNMGKYLVAFLRNSDRIRVKPSTEIVIYGDFGHNLYVNVYLIFDGFNKQYQLPFIIQRYNQYKEVGINWFDANELCMKLYGTYLTSIHSKDENMLIHGFIGDEDSAWIGFMDFDRNDRYNYNNYVSRWRWIDRSFISYTDWRMAEPQHKDGDDCAFMEGKYGGWSAGDCDKRDKVRFACASPYWYPNQQRTFEMNVEDRIDEIAIISIGNNNEEDAICIDSISVDDQVPVDITNNWIGAQSSDYSLRAIFKAPVCKTEVIEMKALYETAVSLGIPTARHIPSYVCRSETRLSEKDEKCALNWLYGFGSSTIFRLSGRGIRNKHISWASASNVTLSTELKQSIVTTNDFNFDKLFFIRYVTNGANGSYEINNIKRLELRPRSLFYDINEEQYDEDIVNILQSIVPDRDEEDDEFKEQIWEHSPFVDVQRCIGSVDVPPAHTVPYEIWLGGVLIEVNVEVDLKLTLCPEFVNTELHNEDSNIIYLSNVSAQVYSLQGNGCTIIWGIPQYINNTEPCDTVQQLSIFLRHEYLPRCNSKNSTLFDGCQCNIGDTDKRGVCWCVDQNGNKIGGKAMYVEDATTWQETCKIGLNCSNTEVTVK